MGFMLQDRIPGFTCICAGIVDQSRIVFRGSFVDVQHLFGICGNITTTVSGIKNGRGRKYHQSLPIRIRILQRPVSVQLGVPLLCRGSLRLNCYSRWIGANGSLL